MRHLIRLFSLSLGRVRTDRRAQVIAAVLLLAAPATRAAHPLITEDTGTQGSGNFQLELTGEYAREQRDDVLKTAFLGQAVLSYGLRDNLDLILGVPYLRLTSSSVGEQSTVTGGGDVGIDLKWRFFEQGDLSLAVKPGITLPTGDRDKELGSARVRSSVYGVMSYTPDPWGWHLHMGYLNYNNIEGDHRSLWHLSTAGWYVLAKRYKFVVDIGAIAAPEREADSYYAFATGGLITSLTEKFDIDIGYRHALTELGPPYTLLAGMTFRW